ncbi:hypothetical protein N7456_007872 [Penicillium angulare]|uniref:WGR domain-containing protein n=1 Tax=Penicillium angulare TaxID=116970 RepID=A0A9W9FBN1_9EURO|nr:hypothetical protein N7456_007872 [Penicillium angulare]
MPTKAFEHVHVATVGKFEDGEKFQGWKAKELGTVHIVHVDWLYDSLQTKPSPRPRKAVSYLWDNILELELRPRKRSRRLSPPQSASKAKGRIKDPFAQTTPAKRRKTVALPKENVYVDESVNEHWDATMLRPQPDGKREKFRLAIFKSTQKPETYAAYAKYSRIGKSEVSVLAPPKSSLALAKTKLKEFFLLQTGIEWENRTKSTLPLPKKDDEGNTLPFHEGWYMYQAGSTMSAFLKQPNLSQPAAASQGDVPPVGESEDLKSPVDEHLSTADRRAPRARFGSIEEDSGFDADVEVDSLEVNLAQSFRESSPCTPGEEFGNKELQLED